MRIGILIHDEIGKALKYESQITGLTMTRIIENALLADKGHRSIQIEEEYGSELDSFKKSADPFEKSVYRDWEISRRYAAADDFVSAERGEE